MKTEHDIADINAMLEEIAVLHRLHAAAPALLSTARLAVKFVEIESGLRDRSGLDDAYTNDPKDLLVLLRAAIALTEPPKP